MLKDLPMVWLSILHFAYICIVIILFLLVKRVAHSTKGESPILMGLNKRQSEAVTSNANRLLIIAGAGSGKTKTLIQRIAYLVLERDVKPTDILAITFTRNAAQELRQRLAEMVSGGSQPSGSLPITWISRLTVATFHGLCYRIMREDGVNEFDNRFRLLLDAASARDVDPGRVAPETFLDVAHRVLIQLCGNRQYILDLKRYILDYLVEQIPDVAAHESFNDGKFYVTLGGERVRSKSEQRIADWLYRHAIRYQYEPQINLADFPFHPDFYVPQGDFFIEHISDRSSPLQNKLKQMDYAGRKCFLIHEEMMRDSSLFNRHMDRLMKGRLEEHPREDVAAIYEEEFRGIQGKVGDFLKQALRVMDKIKVENIPLETIGQRAEEDPHFRVRDFYRLVIPLFKAYQNHCVSQSYMDFNDLLIRTDSLLANQPEIRKKYRKRFKYILVDEFQDVNTLQVQFLKALLSPSTQLFCVGDDWQSIYGFRGSEVDYIIHFQRYFRGAHVLKLNLNYRSTQTIVGASNEVIKHNKHKVEKDITAFSKALNTIQVFKANLEQDDGVSFLTARVREFLAEGVPSEEILVLYRRTKHFEPYRVALRKSHLTVKARTIHSAKGLEARVVFVVGLKDGPGGFPDIWMDDRIFRVIKPISYHLAMEEERRLFYVAITRAREELVLITEVGNESTFINEIPATYFNRVQYSVSASSPEESHCCFACQALVRTSFKYCPYCGHLLNLP